MDAGWEGCSNAVRKHEGAAAVAALTRSSVGCTTTTEHDGVCGVESAWAWESKDGISSTS